MNTEFIKSKIIPSFVFHFPPWHHCFCSTCTKADIRYTHLSLPVVFARGAGLFSEVLTEASDCWHLEMNYCRCCRCCYLAHCCCDLRRFLNALRCCCYCCFCSESRMAYNGCGGCCWWSGGGRRRRKCGSMIYFGTNELALANLQSFCQVNWKDDFVVELNHFDGSPQLRRTGDKYHNSELLFCGWPQTN